MGHPFRKRMIKTSFMFKVIVFFTLFRISSIHAQYQCFGYALEPSELVLREGEDGSFSCHYNGADFIDFKWNGIPLSQQRPEGITLSANGSMLFVTGRRQHNGARVQCVATVVHNVQGSKHAHLCHSHNATVSIEEPVTATPIPTGASTNFTTATPSIPFTDPTSIFPDGGNTTTPGGGVIYGGGLGGGLGGGVVVVIAVALLVVVMKRLNLGCFAHNKDIAHGPQRDIVEVRHVQPQPSQLDQTGEVEKKALAIVPEHDSGNCSMSVSSPVEGDSGSVAVEIEDDMFPAPDAHSEQKAGNPSVDTSDYVFTTGAESMEDSEVGTKPIEETSSVTVDVAGEMRKTVGSFSSSSVAPCGSRVPQERLGGLMGGPDLDTQCVPMSFQNQYGDELL